MQRGEDAQVRVGEQPAFCLPTGGSGGAHNGPEAFAAGHGTKMLCADPRQAGNFVFGENFLSGFNNDHFFATLFSVILGCSALLIHSTTLGVTSTSQLHQKLMTPTHYFPSNSSAVYMI
jgi:hypothetical protein